MRPAAVREFIELLEQQVLGATGAIAAIHDLDFSIADGCCLFNLYGQWTGAFSYQPGRLDALAPIFALAKKVPRWKSDNPAYLYKQPEWAQLLALRGPVQSVDMYGCNQCGCEHPMMNVSPFVGLVGLVCPGCRSVQFRSGYNEQPPPACECGKRYTMPFPNQCPSCRSGLVKSHSLSPYEYFETYTFKMPKK